MKITKKEVYSVASLAKLNIADAEAESLTSDLEHIIAFANTITKYVDADESPKQDTSSQLREDNIQPSFPKSEMLKNAPFADENGFLVPKVLE